MSVLRARVSGWLRRHGFRRKVNPGTSSPKELIAQERHQRLEAIVEAVDRAASAVPTAGPRRVAAAVAASKRIRDGLAREWTQIDVEPVSWRGQVEEVTPDLVVIELAAGQVPGWGPADGAVRDLVRWATQSEVSVIVWVTTGSADPDVSEHLIAPARVVCIADPEAVESWRRRWPKSRIEVLLPAAQPLLHTPELGGPSSRRLGEAVIVLDGTGCGPESVEGIDELVAPMTKLLSSPDLHLWNLNGETEAQPLLPAVRAAPPRPYELASKAAGCYRVLVDAGRSRPDSAWSLFEAGAAQTAVVTLPAQRQSLPESVAMHVATADDPVAFRRQVAARVNQPELRDREALNLHRAVLAGHTYAHRADELLVMLGRPRPRPDRSVSVVVPTNREHQLDNVFENVGRQQHNDVELILVLHGLAIPHADLEARARAAGVDRLTVIDADAGRTLGSLMNMGLDVAGGAYIAKMDDDNFYGRHYLTDLVNAFACTDAGIVGKWAHYVWLRSLNAVVLRFERHEHTYTRLVQGGSIVAESTLAKDLRFSDLPRAVDSDFLNRARAAGVKTYSADRFNFVSVRGVDRHSHTWKISDVEMMVGAARLTFFGDPRTHVDA